MKGRYILAWFPGIPIAIINGAIREYVFSLFLYDLAAHQFSVISFMVLFGAYVWYILPWLEIPSSRVALRIGLLWIMLTVVFEFLFGHFVMGHSWSRLFYDYNLLDGRLWVIVLMWTTLAPLVLYNLRYSD